MIGNVIGVTPGADAKAPPKIQLAASVDDIDAKRFDIELTMSGPLTVKQTPKVGDEFKFGGVPDGYVPKPFVMQMISGTLLTAAPPPGAKKPPVHHKPTH
jgi:hypothetical protein